MISKENLCPLATSHRTNKADGSRVAAELRTCGLGSVRMRGKGSLVPPVSLRTNRNSPLQSPVLTTQMQPHQTIFSHMRGGDERAWAGARERTPTWKDELEAGWGKWLMRWEETRTTSQNCGCHGVWW